MEDISIREYLKNYDEGKYESPDRKTQIDAGWFDWFCKDSSLKNKTVKLTTKLKQIVNSPKINQNTMYVFFKNNCPLAGSLYDDFRICDLESGDVIYTITPRSGHTVYNNRAEVWGKENNFDGPLVVGKWKDVKDFFNQNK